MKNLQLYGGASRKYGGRGRSRKTKEKIKWVLKKFTCGVLNGLGPTKKKTIKE